MAELFFSIDITSLLSTTAFLLPSLLLSHSSLRCTLRTCKSAPARLEIGKKGAKQAKGWQPMDPAKIRKGKGVDRCRNGILTIQWTVCTAREPSGLSPSSLQPSAFPARNQLFSLITRPPRTPLTLLWSDSAHSLPGLHPTVHIDTTYFLARP